MTPRLPPKKDVAIALLERSSVFIHLDPRREKVAVPPWFKKRPQLVLQIGLNMPVPIRDLNVDEECISCTLSFNRSPFFCWVPWDAIYALVGEDGRGMVWPEDIPPEVAAQTPKGSAEEAPAPAAAPKPRGHLRAVRSEEPPADASLESGTGAAESAGSGAIADESTHASIAGETGGAAGEADDTGQATADTHESKRPIRSDSKTPAIRAVPGPTGAQEEPRHPTASGESSPPALAVAGKTTPSTPPADESVPAALDSSKKPNVVAVPAETTTPDPAETATTSSSDESTDPPDDGAKKRKLPPYLRIVK